MGGRFTSSLGRLCLAAGMICGSGVAAGEIGEPLTQEELQTLLEGGREMTLGGPGMGYAGRLTLGADGTGAGSARTDAGQEIVINGAWRLADGRFCRTWAGLDGGAEVCETWVRTSETSVDVFNGDSKIGVNSW